MRPHPATALALAVWLLAALAPAPALASIEKPRETIADGSAPFMAKLVARGFFRALVAGDVASMLPLCAERVSFDGVMVSAKPELRRWLERIATRARRRSLRLRRLVVLRQREMRRQFGPAPRRLAAVVRPGHAVAVARFDRRGAIAVLARVGSFYRVVALSD